ncbi:aminotransferase class V-fold PLP-dependent enzyme [Plastoroseomonas hellenica]|uniref:aminotransferase class V-fold PLP-dependent enzyme n=1 Tax=Plastoroseomonas hellenica TaxID=2687306 RepID=UPI001BACFB5C|nr:aminotransferase class V-fold PLP-dependent enzyme [Plastoroseomonas hellenica]MBR0646744.1 aminotransferase class V-fold PLP-dependent enzyme [Plastoroseomonas hellenica]
MHSPFDLEALRAEFPAAQRMLYLDTAHQAPLATSIRAALHRFYDEGHVSAGPKPVWLQRVEAVRARLAAFIGAAPEEIAFTKNTSEGLNIAANAIPLVSGDNVLMVHGDHPNNAYAFLNLRRKGVETRFVPLTAGTADIGTFAPHVDARTRAISISHVTFHAGHRFDVEALGRFCRDRGLLLVVDAMQSVGVLPIDVKRMDAAFVAAGCHKGLLVPQGMGFLYVDAALQGLEPAYLAAASLAEPPADFIARPDRMELRHGAGRFEIGNFNLPDLHALSAALDLIERVGVGNIERHVLALGDRLIAALDRLGIRLIGPRDRAQRAHIYVLDLPGEGWLDYLTASHVRVSPERDGIRVSFGLFNTAADVDRLVEILARRIAMPERELAAG